MTEDAMARSSLFRDMTQEERALLVSGAKQDQVPQDHTLFRMGETGVPLFIVVSGSVRVERPGAAEDVEITTLGPGSTFGEMSFVDGSKTTAYVRAVQPTEVLVLPVDTLESIFSDYPKVAAKLWRNLALEFKHRLELTNQLVDHYVDRADVLRENPAAGVLLGRV